MQIGEERIDLCARTMRAARGISARRACRLVSTDSENFDAWQSREPGGALEAHSCS